MEPRQSSGGTIGGTSQPAISPADFAALVEMIGAGEPEVVVDLLDTYLDESAELVAAIVASHTADNAAAMLRPAHSLKSSSASVGAMQLSRLCADLEGYLRGGGALDVGSQVRRIQLEFGRVQEALAVEKARLLSP